MFYLITMATTKNMHRLNENEIRYFTTNIKIQRKIERKEGPKLIKLKKLTQ